MSSKKKHQGSTSVPVAPTCCKSLLVTFFSPHSVPHGVIMSSGASSLVAPLIYAAKRGTNAPPEHVERAARRSIKDPLVSLLRRHAA